MSIKLGINGFGRIGRLVLRASLVNPDVEVVALNDLTDSATMAHLFIYDSVHGKVDRQVAAKDNAMAEDDEEEEEHCEESEEEEEGSVEGEDDESDEDDGEAFMNLLMGQVLKRFVEENGREPEEQELLALKSAIAQKMGLTE